MGFSPNGKTIQKNGISQTLWHLNRLTLGRLFSILRGDIGYAWWRLRNLDASFSSYYAATITKKLDQGKAHRTLGKKRHGPANFLAGGEQLGPANSLKHGSFAFKKITRLGLQPHHLCVDFGCGSLRIGQHLIGYLKSGRYIGLDITDRFIRDGLDLLDTGMLQAKDPKIHVINEPILQAVTQMKPDYIICVSVLMHVPPHELDAFFDRILRLMTSQTTLLLFFDESSSPIRTEAKSWAYSVASLTDYVRCRLPDARVSSQPGSVKGRIGKSEFRRSILIIKGGQKNRPALPESYHASFISYKVSAC
ncbi:MAG: class I SAM-dependent methyltransferase [Nitrospirales bacterium]